MPCSLPPNVSGTAPSQVRNYVLGLDSMVRVAVLGLEPEADIVAVGKWKERRTTPPTAAREADRLHDGDPPQRRPCGNGYSGPPNPMHTSSDLEIYEWDLEDSRQEPPSAFGSFGSPRIISPMMLRCT